MIFSNKGASLISDEKYVRCSKIYVDTHKLCNMRGSTIGSVAFTLADARDDEVEEILYEYHKLIFFLPETTAEIFPNLKNYRAEYCRIRKVSRNNFKNLFLLQRINLIDNQIEHIPDDLFEGLTSLEQIKLGRITE